MNYGYVSSVPQSCTARNIMGYTHDTSGVSTGYIHQGQNHECLCIFRPAQSIQLMVTGTTHFVPVMSHQTVQIIPTRRIFNLIALSHQLNNSALSQHQRASAMPAQSQRASDMTAQHQHAPNMTTQHQRASAMPAQRHAVSTRFPHRQFALGNMIRYTGGVPSNRATAAALGGVPSNRATATAHVGVPSHRATATAPNRPDVRQSSSDMLQSVFADVEDILNAVSGFAMYMETLRHPQPEPDVDSQMINRIHELTSSKYTGDEDAAGGDRCSICLGDYAKGDDLRHLPCRHMFHSQCVDQWFNTNSSCPLCRQDVMRNRT